MFCIGCIGGFVFGARAGRTRYEQIKRLGTQVIDSRTTQSAVGLAQQGLNHTVDAVAKLRTHAPEYRAAVADAANSLAESATGQLRTSLHEAAEPLKRVSISAQQVPEIVSLTADTLRTQVTDVRERAQQRQTDEIVSIAQRRDELLDAGESSTDSMLESRES